MLERVRLLKEKITSEDKDESVRKKCCLQLIYVNDLPQAKIFSRPYGEFSLSFGKSARW